MSLLSYNNLCQLVDQRVITNVEHDQINATSIDLTLGPNLLIEGKHPDAFENLLRNGREGVAGVCLRDRTPLFMRPHNLEQDGPYDLLPGEFILASSAQIFNLPRNVSAEYKLKSSMARIGLEHLNAGWCDAGWHGSVLTLELKNMTRHHAIRLQVGDRIGQVVFFMHAEVPADRSYAARGRYNNDESVSGIKP
jgi:deoxycytidine triphosphate deaminase